VLKAFAIGHDEIGVGDGGPVNKDRSGADRVPIMSCLHDSTSRPITNYKAAFFDLDDSREQL